MTTLTPTEITVLAGLIFLAAALYSTVGHAGASAYLALLALAGVAPEIMKPTALVLNILVAVIATSRFGGARPAAKDVAAQGEPPGPQARLWPFVLTSIPAAMLGGSLLPPAPLYRHLLGFALMFAGLRLFGLARGAVRPINPPSTAVALVCGAVIGLISGVIGVGGGIFLSPVLLLAGWADARRTAALSAMFILVNSIAGLFGHVAALHGLPVLVLPWAAAAAAGGFLGATLGSRRFSNLALRRALAVVVLAASVKLVLA